MGCYNTGLGSFQKWAIGNVVRNILLENEEIKKQVKDNIFPVVAPEVTKGDFILYRRTQYSKSSVKMGVYEDRCELTLLVVSDNYDNSFALASKIDNVLNGRHNIDEKRVDIMLSDSSEGWEDNKYIQTLIYTIK